MSIEEMKQALKDVRFAREALAGEHLRSCDGHLKALAQSLTQAIEQAEKQELGARSLKEAVFLVLEGFTLPHDVRKILETAYYTTPPTVPAQKGN